MSRRLLLVVCVLILAITLFGCGTAVPGIKGMTVQQATQAVESAGFQVGKVTYDEKATGVAGAVIAQRPEADMRAKGGSLVILTVAGPPPVPAPALGGLDKDKAAATLAASGLKLGVVTESFDASVSAGMVASQTPAAGADAPKGSSVALVISKGPQPVALPSVKGKTQADATKSLQGAGFKVKSEQKADTAKKGTVIAQKPADGEARPGATVVITVSTGVEAVEVPNVDGVFFTDAKAQLERAGFDVKDISVYAGDGGRSTDGSVYEQSPKGGVLAPRGSLVTIWWGYEHS
ncbi:MAG: PASTA domain-containing protein [Actinomycetes bacterium]